MITPTKQLEIDIGEAVHRACSELPEGYDLHIELERNAGTIRLYLPDTDAAIDEFDGDTFGEKINSAINEARRLSTLSEPADGVDKL